jgi:hypothetical protein
LFVGAKLVFQLDNKNMGCFSKNLIAKRKIQTSYRSYNERLFSTSTQTKKAFDWLKAKVDEFSQEDYGR